MSSLIAHTLKFEEINRGVVLMERGEHFAWAGAEAALVQEHEPRVAQEEVAYRLAVQGWRRRSKHDRRRVAYNRRATGGQQATTRGLALPTAARAESRNPS